MDTDKSTCFSHPDVLEAMSPKWLVRFLKPYSAFLESKGLRLPDEDADCDDLDHGRLLSILMSAESGTPRGLVDSFYYLHEMGTPEHMDGLLEEADAQGIPIDDDPTPLDVAIQVWLHDEDLLKHQHAERSLDKPYTFVYFQSVVKPDRGIWVPEPHRIRALQGDLEDYFEKRMRGRYCHVGHYVRDEGVRFVVGHGEPVRREGCVCGHKLGRAFYRPESHDLVVYQTGTGELQVHAGTHAETETYRMLFGRHLFGDDHHFPGDGKYTLEPLRKDGEASLVCSDIDGLDCIALSELQCRRGGRHGDCETHMANDVFAALRERHEKIPDEARLTSASFRVRFSDSITPRTVAVEPSNVAHYERDSDSERVAAWLKKRGFALLSYLLVVLSTPWMAQLMCDSEEAVLSTLA